MQKNQTVDIEDFLGSILRGAAKMLGCGTANLLIFNTRAGEIYVRVGTIGDRIIRLQEVEAIFGSAFQKTVFPIGDTTDSLVYRCWHDQTVHETSSVSKLAGSFFSENVRQTMSSMLTGTVVS